jgi:hypothetical protein
MKNLGVVMPHAGKRARPSVPLTRRSSGEILVPEMTTF